MPTGQSAKANAPSKAGGVMTAVGIVMILIGVGLMATVALTLPGLILALAGAALAAFSYFSGKAAARAPRA